MKKEELQLEMIRAQMSHFHETFRNRPLMLGTPEQVVSMFFVVDQIDFILKTGKPMHHGGYGWTQFLIEKGLIKHNKNHFVESLRADSTNFEPLFRMREAYSAWLENKLKDVDCWNDVMDVVARTAQVAWSIPDQLAVEKPAALVPRIVWEFITSQNEVEQAIVRSVTSYEGSIQWDIASDHRKWVITPRKFVEFQTESNSGADAEKARVAFSSKHQDLVRAAVADLPSLAAHIENVVDGLTLDREVHP
jgi:hypothetical protein